MGNKIGRNDPCWCGSGQKYKRCHLNREKEKPVTDYEANRVLLEAQNTRYCLHPHAGPKSCSRQIIQAHTIQRNGGLNRIARAGHVYQLALTVHALKKTGGIPSITLTGINKASTFTGFCSIHDNQIFEPIERYPFQSNQHHTFLLGYRALCRELFMKQAVARILPFQRKLDKGKSLPDQFAMQTIFNYWELGVNAGLRDLEHHKAEFDKVLVSGDYSTVQYYILRLNNTPDFLCSGAILPEFDFNGAPLQDLGDVDVILAGITFSLIATDKGGAAVFSWLGENEKCRKLIASLETLRDDQIPNAIVRFTFEHFENVSISPDWWDSMDALAKQRIIERFTSGAEWNNQRRADCLKDDGLQAVTWEVTSRDTNLTL